MPEKPTPAADVTANAPPVETQMMPAGGSLQEPQQTPADPQLQLQPGTPAPTTGQKIAGFVTGGQQTPGQLFRGILAGALTGMVAGAGQHHFGQGVAAGGQAAAQQKQQQLQNEVTLSREAQEQKLRQAQIAELNHRITSDTWSLTNQQATAAEQHAEFENGLKKMALEAPGAIDLGVNRNVDDLMALRKAHPDLPQDLAKGNIFAVPHFSPVMGADGKPTGEQKYDGVSAVYVPPQYANQKLDHDIQVPLFTPGKKPDEPGKYEMQTIKAGTVTNREAMTLQSSRAADAAKYDNDATIAKAQSALLKAQTAAKGKPGELDEEDVTTLSHQLATRPENVSLKDVAGLKNNMRSKILARVLRENPNFDAKAYTIALDTMKDFTSGKTADNLTAFNGAIRHLSLLGDAARAFNNNDATLLNRLAAEVRAQVGSSNIATYNAIHAAVSGEVEKVYKGGAPTDVGMQTMSQTFDKAQSPQAAAAAVRTTMELMGEKVQDYYRRFRNGTHSTPEREGIEFVNPDVQDILTRYGVGAIQAGPPPGQGGAQQQGQPGADPNNPLGLKL